MGVHVYEVAERLLHAAVVAISLTHIEVQHSVANEGACSQARRLELELELGQGLVEPVQPGVDLAELAESAAFLSSSAWSS